MAVTTVDLGSVKGPQGTRGSRWSQGTAITGTSTTATVFSGTGITDALINDNYLNTSTGNTYRCTVAGAASVAKWVYTGNLRGATGATGPQGATGPKGDNTTAAQVSYSKSGTSTTVQAELDTLNGSLNNYLYIGRYRTSIAMNADLNTYKTPGAYVASYGSLVNSLKNCPVSGGQFTLDVISDGAYDGRVMQVIHNYNSAVHPVYIRYLLEGTTWQSWCKFQGTVV